MKKATAVLLLLALMGTASPQKAFSYEEENRTVNRTPTGMKVVPQSKLTLPEHYEFTARPWNHDAQNQHPQQWQGQDWDPSMWNEKWTPEVAIKKFYAAHIFHRQYVRYQRYPVLELGPTFFKLSDLDRRRTLQLLMDYNDVFSKGYDAVELRDWYTKELVGSYTRKGMLLH